MSDRNVIVSVVRDGREIRRIERPLRLLGNREAVVYRGKLWPLQPGGRIVIDQRPIAPTPRAVAKDDDRAEKKQQAYSRVHVSGSAARRSADAGKGSTDGGSAPMQPAPPAPNAPRGCDGSNKALGGLSPMMPDKWDEDQLAVIEAPSNDRLLVDAGPGTGKTAVACRRVAQLIDHKGLTASGVWLISFTRTAVKEIRDRIRHYLQDAADAATVRIATLDSHAWAIHSGFDETASLDGSYESNIERVVELIRGHEGVFDYLSSVRHVIVDEGQDIVGVRADLVLELIRNLDPGCGVTVFADEGQAIYGFADEDGRSIGAQGNLPERLRRHRDLGFRELSLARIYRTTDPRLCKLFTEVRAVARAPECGGQTGRLEKVRQMVRDLAHDQQAKVDDIGNEEPEVLARTFLLFRSRAEALMAASFRGLLPHRLRMSGLPPLIEPWLGVVFWDYTEPYLKKSAFERLWTDRIAQRAVASISCEDAWQILLRTAGDGRERVSMSLLRQKLARPAPPPDLMRSDFGLGGPVFGTIHGCKGREADHAWLMLLDRMSKDANEAEEARVVFVGATRARERLRTGASFTYIKARRVDPSGRALALQRQSAGPRAQVEFGRTGDLVAEGVASRRLFRSADELVDAQRWLEDRACTIHAAIAEQVEEFDWRYRVMPLSEGESGETLPGTPLAYFSRSVNSDLFDVGRQVGIHIYSRSRLRPHAGPNHLRIFGACSLVMHPDDPARELAHEPWSSSGFILAPVVQGFDMIYFRSFRGR